MSRVGLAGALIVPGLIMLGSVVPAGGHAVLAQSGGEEPPPPVNPAPVVTVNEFLPEDQDLDACLSSLPRPNCGSHARGGWRQGLVFGLVVAGLAVIAWRIIVAARRTRAAADAAEGSAGVSDADRADRRRTPPSR